MRIGVRLGPLYVSTSTRRRRKPKVRYRPDLPVWRQPVVGGQVRKVRENRAADWAAAARAMAQAAADRAADQAAAFGVLEYNRGEPALAWGAAQTVPVDPAKDAPAGRPPA